jgi:arylsulfatase A-like enzyme
MGHKNVLFLVGDQWRGDSLSAAGHPVVKTPNLDRLVADGVLFRNHFTQCSPCGPARASLFTGLYLMNHRSGRNGTPLDARHTNVALEARRLGYDPMLFGYTDTSVDPRTVPPGDPSLSTYESVLPGLTVLAPYHNEVLDPWLRALRHLGYDVPAEPMGIYAPVPDYPGARERGPTFAPPRFRAEHSDTAYLADQVVDFVTARTGELWFTVASFLRPHPPCIAPEPYNSLYHPDEVAMPARAARADDEAALHPFVAYALERQRRPGYFTGHPFNVQALAEHEVRQLRATYYGLIAELDHHLGRIFDALKASGQYDDTLIVFTADHGEMLGEHWMYGKETFHDGAFHIPLIVRDPRATADATRGTRVSLFTEAVDVTPTVLDWLGAAVPPQMDGASLLGLLAGAGPETWRKEAHWELDFRDVAGLAAERGLGLTSDQCALAVVRDEAFKYVHFAALPPLLFDLRADPGEFRNVAADPAYRDQALAYAQRMLSWRITHADRTLANIALTEDGLVERRGPRQ